MRMFELKQMEVINERTCRRLGYVSDIDIDMDCGCIIAIIVPGCAKVFGIFGIDKEYVIPVKCIRQIGEDIILVDVDEEEIYVTFK
jgi:YlmC/YmxH family sporulation protein